jgi:hypothetical protein
LTLLKKNFHFLLPKTKQNALENDFGHDDASDRITIITASPLTAPAKKARELFARARIAHISPPGVTSNKLAAIFSPLLLHLQLFVRIIEYLT